MDEQTLNRLQQLFPPPFLDHLLRPSRRGTLPAADGVGVATSDCGHDRVEIQLALRAGDIMDAAFDARGCAHTQACASAATDLLIGQPLAAARRHVSAESISEALGTLDVAHIHCAALVVRALTAALDDALRTSREPWRKAYRK